MVNYLGNFKRSGELREKVTKMIWEFQIPLGTKDEPAIEGGDDPRLTISHLLVAEVDSIFFTPGALLDQNYLSLVSTDGDTDHDARFPEIPDVVVPADAAEEDEEDQQPDPPTSDPVVKRLMVIIAITARGLLENNHRNGIQSSYSRADIHDWFAALGVEAELEVEENTTLTRPIGDLAFQDALNSAWRLEEIAVLGWALGPAEIPKYDQLVEADELLGQLGFLDKAMAEKHIANASLRPPEELDIFNNQILSLHWRMVDFRVGSRQVDYAHMAEESWFGRMDLSWAEFVNKDLAIDGIAITAAHGEHVQSLGSAAQERHLACNWLAGHSKIYPDTDTST
jgi:hypothetical protein